MNLRLGEWLVLIGSGVIIIFAVLVGTLVYLKPPPIRFVYLETSQSRSGEAVYRREGCSSCHEVFGNGASYGPQLDGVGSRRNESWLRQYMRSPRQGVGEKSYRLKMPTYDKLNSIELETLVAYLQALREQDAF